MKWVVFSKKEDDKEKWLNAYKGQEYDREYREYLNDLFSKDGIKAVGMSYDAFLAIRENKRLEELEKKKQQRLHRIAHSRVKLTNAEKYLANASRISKNVHMKGVPYNEREKHSVSKTPSEIRRDINKMRKKKNYPGLKKLNEKIKAGILNNINDISALSSLVSEMCEDVGYDIVNQAMHSSPEYNDVMAFILAEDKIEGMPEEEIEKLYMIEQL